MGNDRNALAVGRPRGALARLAAELRSREVAEDRAPLLRREQVGLLPSMSFWLRADVRHFVIPTYLAGLATALVVASGLGAPPLAAALLGSTLPFLGLGLLERAVRRAALRRATAASQVVDR